MLIVLVMAVVCGLTGFLGTAGGLLAAALLDPHLLLVIAGMLAALLFATTWTQDEAA